ncbi:hypothetical protein OXX79_008575 [Metschnikowia pulcherrima]
MGSGSGSGFFVEGQGLIMKSSYSSTAAHVSSGNSFDTFGCRDIFKGMEDDFQDWMFNEGLVGDDKESVG